LLKACGVQPIREGKLRLRKRVIPGKQAWFLTNPAGEPVTETVDIGQAQVEDLLGEPIQREGGHVTLTVDGLDVRVLIIQDV
jgi:hypothetical protein